jgi:hypothetical protein
LIVVDTQHEERQDKRRADFSAEGQWLSTYAWGLALVGAILAALVAWALFGYRADVPQPQEPAPVIAPVPE